MLCHAVTFTFESMTLNVCSVLNVTWSNSVPNFSKIRRPAAELLLMQQNPPGPLFGAIMSGLVPTNCSKLGEEIRTVIDAEWVCLHFRCILFRCETTAPQVQNRCQISRFLTPPCINWGGRMGEVSKSVFKQIVSSPSACFTFPPWIELHDRAP